MLVVSRLLLLLLAVGALVAAVVTTSRDGARGAFVCPMHPEVRAVAAGACPICGMALEPAARIAAARPGDLPDLADLAAVENVRRHNIVDFVRRRTLLGSERELRGPARVEDDGTITAILYRDQAAALGRDEAGVFAPSDAPARAVAVRRAGDAATPWDGATTQVRFWPDARRGAVPSGQVGWLTLTPRPRQVLTVPAAAVLQSPDGPYVLVSTGGFAFERRPIEIGETFVKEGFAVVLGGVRLNERVVARAAFFLDADRRLGRDAADPLTP